MLFASVSDQTMIWCHLLMIKIYEYESEFAIYEENILSMLA